MDEFPCSNYMMSENQNLVCLKERGSTAITRRDSVNIML